jgi:hypothetical protein
VLAASLISVNSVNVTEPLTEALASTTVPVSVGLADSTTLPVPVIVYSPTTPALLYNTFVVVPLVIVVVPTVIPDEPLEPAEPPPPEPNGDGIGMIDGRFLSSFPTIKLGFEFIFLIDIFILDLLKVTLIIAVVYLVELQPD